MSPSASDLLLREGLQAALIGWQILRVEGHDRERFLSTQLTSHVKSLALDMSQPTALLDRVGRLRFFGFLARREGRFDLLAPEAADAAGAIQANLVADDVRLSVVEAPRLRLVLGAEAVRLSSRLDPASLVPVAGWGSRGFVLLDDTSLGLEEIEPAELDALAVASGQPRWGIEAAAGIPVVETPLLDTAVAFDKGCFLGQETVAKVMSGRGPARGVMLLEVEQAPPGVAAGQAFATPERGRAGRVLSTLEWEDRHYLVVRLARELRVRNRRLDCRLEGGLGIAAIVRELPLVAAREPAAWARELTVAASAAFSADRDGEAIALLERAVAVCPTYADAYEALGVIHGRHGRYDEAVGLMLRLLEVDPGSVMAHTNLSLYYNRQGRIEDAEREAAAAMRAEMRRSQDAKAHEHEAQAAAEAAAADRRRRAELFRQVLEIDPFDPLANFGLGELDVEEGRFEEALTHLRRALEADPRHSAALLAVGRAHEGVGDRAAARTAYRNGIEIAAARGDLMTANKMQERLAKLADDDA